MESNFKVAFFGHLFIKTIFIFQLLVIKKQLNWTDLIGNLGMWYNAFSNLKKNSTWLITLTEKIRESHW
jgi:hypothetical protein